MTNLILIELSVQMKTDFFPPTELIFKILGDDGVSFCMHQDF